MVFFFLEWGRGEGHGCLLSFARLGWHELVLFLCGNAGKGCREGGPIVSRHRGMEFRGQADQDHGIPGGGVFFSRGGCLFSLPSRDKRTLDRWAGGGNEAVWSWE